MTEQGVRVTTPSRLHFGLARLGTSGDVAFGGLGAMIAPPQCVVTIRPSDLWRASGPHADRALATAWRTWEQLNSVTPAATPALEVVVESAPALHCGLGVGTQLTCAVAEGVRRLGGWPRATADELARRTGRGQRSAVGLHGFAVGGLIWDGGRRPNAALGALAARCKLNENWRFVLALPPDEAGLHGEEETAAFDRLPALDAEVTQALISLAEQDILPAAQASQFERFAEALANYGQLAGQAYAAVQPGTYGSAAGARWAAALTAAGVRGVGQSSWGPTVFGLLSCAAEAPLLVAACEPVVRDTGWELTFAAADNHGARVELLGEDAKPASSRRPPLV